MNQPLLLEYPAWLVAAFLFLTILLFIWFGSLFRKFETRKGKDIPAGPLSPVENSMLNLMSLMLAFTFGMALTKFESRRKAIVDETNAIESAILRADLFPDSVRSLLRNDLANYIDARIAFNEAGANYPKIRIALDQASAAYKSMWQRVATASRNSVNPAVTNQTIPVLSAVINNATTREAERIAKVPPLILVALMILVMTGSFLIGYNHSATKRSQIFVVGFALMTTVTLYLILELERPWGGLINLKSTEQRIVNLRATLMQ